jgi:hypothetical protein
MNNKNLFYQFASLILFSFFMSFSASAQSKLDVKDNKWNQLLNVNGITIDYSKGKCEGNSNGIDKEEIYLQFTNSNATAMTIDWEYDLTYVNNTHNLEGASPEFQKSITIPANSSLNGQCKDKNNDLKFLVQFIGFESDVLLTDFNIKNIKISK